MPNTNGQHQYNYNSIPTMGNGPQQQFSMGNIGQQQFSMGNGNKVVQQQYNNAPGMMSPNYNYPNGHPNMHAHPNMNAHPNIMNNNYHPQAPMNNYSPNINNIHQQNNDHGPPPMLSPELRGSSQIFRLNTDEGIKNPKKNQKKPKNHRKI